MNIEMAKFTVIHFIRMKASKYGILLFDQYAGKTQNRCKTGTRLLRDTNRNLIAMVGYSIGGKSVTLDDLE